LFPVAGPDPSPLEDRLMSCEIGPFHRGHFSIAQHGALPRFRPDRRGCQEGQ
jgi:hypothetical protein